MPSGQYLHWCRAANINDRVMAAKPTPRPVQNRGEVQRPAYGRVKSSTSMHGRFAAVAPLLRGNGPTWVRRQWHAELVHIPPDVLHF